MKKVLLLLALLVGAAFAFYVHAGYYSGPVFTDIPVASAPTGKPAIVMLSGDMGNHIGMTPKLAERLNRRGYAVVTVNSLTYFSSRRTRAETAALIRQAMTRAMALGRADSVILIGQSFGADMLHAGLAQFTKEQRAPIHSVVLIVPGEDIIFRASPVELAGLEVPDERAYPKASQLRWVGVTCVYGREETDSLCPQLHAPNVQRIALPGGHKLHADDRALEAAILPGFHIAGQLPVKEQRQ